MTLQEAEHWVENQEWVWAKSYAKTFPHHYTTRKLCKELSDDNSLGEKKFEEFISLIRDKGILKCFWKKQYLYLEIGKYEYWEMGRPIPAVQVLNRGLIDDSQNYRLKVIPGQEELIKEKFRIREEHLHNLLSKKEKTEQDQRQIDFLLNTTRRMHGGGKNILDHSQLQLRYE